MIDLFMKKQLLKRISKKNLNRLFYSFEIFGLDALLISTVPDNKKARLFYLTADENLEDFDGLFLSTHRILNALKEELKNQGIKLDFELDAIKK